MYDFVYPKLLDIQQIFDDLSDRGVRPFRVATLLGKEWSTVQRWLEGSEPRGSDERALLELHARHCGETLTRQRVAEAVPRL